MQIAVCGIAGEGTREGNQMVLASSWALKKKNVPVYLSYIAGDEGEFSWKLRDNSQYFDFKSRRELNLNLLNKGSKVSSTLMSGLRRCITRALSEGVDIIVYTELDKPEFCANDLDGLVGSLREGKADVTIAQRSMEGWKEFPLAQRLVEGAANAYLTRVSELEELGIGKIDFLYGPKAFTRNTIGLFNERRDNDWATITYPVIAAARAGYRVLPVSVPGYPQEGYLGKYPWFMRNFAGQLAWRTLQCKPLISAAKHAKKMHD